MFKINKNFAAVALAATSIAATAQDMSSATRSDLFNQDVSPTTSTSTSETSLTPAQQRRLSITNGQNGEPGTNLTRNGMSARTNGMQGRQGMQFDTQEGNLDGREWNNRQARRERKPSEFQKFIADNTGKMLPIFGSEFFNNAPSTFAPVSSAPVPSDYPLGPGDQLMIRGWGTIDIDYQATIDRNGTISIPTIGSVTLAGVKAGDAQNVVRAAVARLYKGVTVNVTFGQLRAITVYVVGQASRPGTYTVSSLSTLVTALFASGGPNANGSMRHVQVKRGGKVAAELDLYAFIAKGDKSGDIKLQDGDTIFLPPAGGFVALSGKVNSQAVFELKTGTDSVESLLDIAGGLPVVADPRRAFLERIDPATNRPRTVEEFALEGKGLKRVLKNGDVLNIISITPAFSNAVILRGNVDQAVRAPFKSGMRVSDLIPTREYLISRKSTRRQNNVIVDSERNDRIRNDEDNRENGLDGYKGRTTLNGIDGNDNLKDLDRLDNRDGRTGNNQNEHDASRQTESIARSIGNLIDQINWDYAVVERINRADLSVNLIPFNLGKVFSNPNGPDNVQLQPGDTVTVFSQDDVAVPMDKRQVFVRVEGEVNVPGVYQMSAGDTLQTLLTKAGGPTSNAYLFGTGFFREQVRKEQEANLEKITARLESQLRSEQSRTLANVRSTADAATLEVRRQAELAAGQEAIARIRRLKPTGRIAFGLPANERSFAHIPQIKLENGDRLLVPARPVFVNVLGAVNIESAPLWRPNTRVKDYLDVTGVTADADKENTFVMRTDGTVVSASARGWFSGGIGGVEVMPGDLIVVPEKVDKETPWTKFTQGTREWAQIFANFGLGAAAIKTLRD
jgi:protein involved in polysaccharide export with SLBB domain